MPKVALAGVSLLALGLAVSLAASMVTNSVSTPELIGLKGRVDMILYDETGNIKDERHFDNLIVNTGLEAVASRIAPHDGTINPTSAFNYIALGISNTAATSADTELSAELPIGDSYSRLQDTQAQYSATESKKLTLSVTFPPGQATGTLRESGIFNASSDGDMLARQTFADVQKAAGDTLTITWTITLT